MKLEYPVYRDKVMGCWAGKNVGGVLGAPFECKRQFNGDVDFYIQDLSKGPVPNDDLDLQLVWLCAGFMAVIAVSYVLGVLYQKRKQAAADAVRAEILRKQ